jgi:uncharacterized protein
MLTSACNMRCDYCAARPLPGPAMTAEIGRKAVDMFVFRAEGARSIEVTLTGGEPLLEFPIVEDLVRYTEQRADEAGMEASFVLKTNGTILSPSILAFMKGHCSKVVVSIDGAPRCHDAHRINSRGTGTHDIVSRNLVALLENGVPCSASVTVHPDISSAVLDNVRYLHGLGVRQVDVGPAYGTVAWDRAASRALTEALGEVALFMREVNRHGGQLEVGPIYRESEHIGQKLTESWGCHAGSTNLAFLPNGQIAGCSALAMLVTTFPELVLGDVRNGLDDEAVARFLERAQAGGGKRPRCQACPTATDCAGGCLAINYSTTGVPLTPPDFYCQTISMIPGAWHTAWADAASKRSGNRQD